MPLFAQPSPERQLLINIEKALFYTPYIDALNYGERTTIVGDRNPTSPVL